MESLFDYLLNEYEKKLPVFYVPPDSRMDKESLNPFILRVYVEVSLKINVAGLGDFGKGVLKRMDMTGLFSTRFYHIEMRGKLETQISIYDGRYSNWTDFERFRLSSQPTFLFVIGEADDIFNYSRDMGEIFGKGNWDDAIPIILSRKGRFDESVRRLQDVMKRTIVIDSSIIDNYARKERNQEEEAFIAMVAMMIVSGLRGPANLPIEYTHFVDHFKIRNVGDVGFGEAGSSYQEGIRTAIRNALDSCSLCQGRGISSYFIFILTDWELSLQDISAMTVWFRNYFGVYAPLTSHKSDSYRGKTAALIIGIHDLGPLTKSLLRH